MPVNLLTKAIILRRTNYGEADRILTLLTPEHGQQTVIARSVRKEKSKLAGGIELFAICELGLAKSSGNSSGMWTLTSSRIIRFYDQVMTDYDRLQFGYEGIKQLARLSDVVESPLLYTTLEQLFGLLDNLKVDLRLSRIWFYLHLANLKGGELNLLTDSNGMKLVEGASYEYNVGDKVLVYSERGGRFTTEVIKLLRILNKGNSDIIYRLSPIKDDVINEALYLARVAVDSC